VIPPFYDSLLAKLIVHGATRKEAISRMERALEMFIIEGVRTSIPFHQQILRHPEFRSGDVHTKFLEHLREHPVCELAAV
jgi:acetyl-CoA carboxylase biotin carboxylase subunit